MSKKTIIRNPNDKSPFTKLEIHILKTMYKALNGASWDKSGYNDFGKLKKIKEIYGFTNIETMYIGSLYKKNYVADGDFDSILPPKIPEMRMYNVNFYQDVSAYRDIHFNIIAGDEDMAIEGSSYDFDYRTESFSEEEWDDPIEIGDYNDVFDTEVEEDPDSLGPLFATPQKNIPNIRLENRNNIKKILKEEVGYIDQYGRSYDDFGDKIFLKHILKELDRSIIIEDVVAASGIETDWKAYIEEAPFEQHLCYGCAGVYHYPNTGDLNKTVDYEDNDQLVSAISIMLEDVFGGDDWMAYYYVIHKYLQEKISKYMKDRNYPYKHTLEW